MVYTIGFTESYRKGLKEHGVDFQKLGAVKNYNKGGYVDYPGGSVFKTARDAFEYILLQEAMGNNITRYTYSVWEVDADWEKDTKNEGKEYNSLLITSRIIREIVL